MNKMKLPKKTKLPIFALGLIAGITTGSLMGTPKAHAQIAPDYDMAEGLATGLGPLEVEALRDYDRDTKAKLDEVLYRTKDYPATLRLDELRAQLRMVLKESAKLPTETLLRYALKRALWADDAFDRIIAVRGFHNMAPGTIRQRVANLVGATNLALGYYESDIELRDGILVKISTEEMTVEDRFQRLIRPRTALFGAEFLRFAISQSNSIFDVQVQYAYLREAFGWFVNDLGKDSYREAYGWVTKSLDSKFKVLPNPMPLPGAYSLPLSDYQASVSLPRVRNDLKYAMAVLEKEENRLKIESKKADFSRPATSPLNLPAESQKASAPKK
jgi:hypothetical protein